MTVRNSAYHRPGPIYPRPSVLSLFETDLLGDLLTDILPLLVASSQHRPSCRYYERCPSARVEFAGGLIAVFAISLAHFSLVLSAGVFDV